MFGSRKNLIWAGFAVVGAYYVWRNRRKLLPSDLAARLVELEQTGVFDPQVATDADPFDTPILFDRGSSEIAPSYRTFLSAASQSYRSSQWGLQIGGHAPEEPTDNYALSQSRAVAVKELLITMGVERDRILVRAFGDTRPTGQGPAADRRVEISKIPMQRYR